MSLRPRFVIKTVLLIAACTDARTGPAPVDSVLIVAPSTSVVEGATMQLVADLRDAANRGLAGRDVAWSSANTATVLVSASGLVTGLQPGVAIVTATSEGISDQFELTVTPTAVAAVVVAPPTAALTVGATLLLSAVATDSAGRTLLGRTPDWSSDDTSLATVSATGLVSALFPGAAEITATVAGVSGSRSIAVVAPSLTSVSSGMSGSFGGFGPGLEGNTGFDHGFSYYTSIHVLQPAPTLGTQLGWGTWLRPTTAWGGTPCPDASAPLPNGYQTIEGGAGIWQSSRAPTALTKFRVNSTPDCYRSEIASTAWTFYGTLLSAAKLGLAQLSNRLLMPPDGLVFSPPDGQQSMLGYGWFALPLVPATTSTLGVVTGDQSWTLFLRASNFSGPISFFTPETFSAVHAADGSASRGLDTKSSHIHGAAIEFGATRSFVASVGGVSYRRIPRITFPVDSQGRAVLLQDLRRYSKAAIWNPFEAWMSGGAAPASMDAAGLNAPNIPTVYSTVKIAGVDATDQAAFSGISFTTPGGGTAFGIRWGNGLEAGVLPEYYQQQAGGTWKPIAVADVPRTSWLPDQSFPAPSRSTFPAVSSSVASPWTSTQWAAGPFSVTLGDGTVVDYVWYKFVEQPAIARLGLSAVVLDELQAFVETLHDAWGANGVAMPLPSSGSLATIHPSLFVTPPAGLEKGFVPIVIQQR